MAREADLEKLSAASRDLLAALWRDIIGVQDISPESEFFALGGDSLQLMTLLFRVQEETGIDLPPGSVFDNPTLGQLASFLAAERLRHASDSAEIIL